MPTFTREEVIGGEISAAPHNDNWAGLETFLNTTKLDADNFQATAQPNNSVYRNVYSASASWATGSLPGAGPFLFGESGAVSQSGSNALSTIEVFRLREADYAVDGLTTKLRVSANVSCNATAPANTIVVGLYPVTVAGGALNLVYTLGTVVTNTTVTFSGPAASTITEGTPSSDITVPADGHYVLGFTSNAAASNSGIGISAVLQMRNTT